MDRTSELPKLRQLNHPKPTKPSPVIPQVDLPPRSQTLNEQVETKKPPELSMTRRLFVGGGLGLLVSTIAEKSGLFNKPRDMIRKARQTPAQNLNQVKTAEIAEIRDELTDAEMTLKLNNILSIRLVNDGANDYVKMRTELEEAYLDKAHTLEEIDKGLMVVVDYGVRRTLMEKRYALRKEGKDDLQPLTKEQEEWVEKNLIDVPGDEQFAASSNVAKEVFAICVEAYNEMLPVIEVLKDVLDTDNTNAYTASQMMISPGGLAALILRETSGMVNIATGGPAVNNYNELEASENNGKESPHKGSTEILRTKLVPYLNNITKLNLITEHIPGSLWLKNGTEDDRTSSGGALGNTQVMPSLVKHLAERFKLARKRGVDVPDYNPFDPKSSAMGVYYKLAEEIFFDTGKRYGYREGDRESQEFALRAWNDLDEEKNFILKRDDSFRLQFPDKSSWQLATTV